MVAALESAERDTPTIPLRFDLMAVDLIEDRDGKWWLTQVPTHVLSLLVQWHHPNDEIIDAVAKAGSVELGRILCITYFAHERMDVRRFVGVQQHRGDEASGTM